MIYIVILITGMLALIEFLLSCRRITPTLTMLCIWAGSLFICSFFQDEVGAISWETLLWISLANFMFFTGGIAGRIIVINKTLRSNVDIDIISIKYLLPVYIITLLLMFQMYLSGSEINNNWYIGMRMIINYGEPNVFFKIFGYMYYILYPALYVSAAIYYLKPTPSGAKSFWSNMVFCMVYAAFSTAKIKLLLVIIPVFFIRTHFRPSSTKLIAALAFMVLSAMYLSLLMLNKISGDGNFSELLITNLGNYTFANIFSFDSLQLSSFKDAVCTDGPGCQLLPFFEGGPFRTNAYTLMYWFVDYGLFVFCVFCFFIGFIHNSVHSLANKSKNIYFVICSSVLYFPLIFQIMDDQYASSKYLLYIAIITYAIYFYKRSNIILVRA